MTWFLCVLKVDSRFKRAIKKLSVCLSEFLKHIPTRYKFLSFYWMEKANQARETREDPTEQKKKKTTEKIVRQQDRSLVRFFPFFKVFPSPFKTF